MGCFSVELFNSSSVEGNLLSELFVGGPLFLTFLSVLDRTIFSDFYHITSSWLPLSLLRQLNLHDPLHWVDQLNVHQPGTCTTPSHARGGWWESPLLMNLLRWGSSRGSLLYSLSLFCPIVWCPSSWTPAPPFITFSPWLDLPPTYFCTAAVPLAGWQECV